MDTIPRASTINLRKPLNRVILVVSVLGGLFVLACIISIASLLIHAAYKPTGNDTTAAEILKNLEAEYDLIAPLEGAIQRRRGSMHKTNQGHVGSDYITDKKYEVIRAHYDDELRKHGWTFIKERPVTVWWQDYGGKEAFYCKGIYTATLQFSGRQEDELGWTYNFTMSWGLFDECE